MRNYEITLKSEGESIQLLINYEYIKNFIAINYAYALVEIERSLNFLGKFTQTQENKYTLESEYSIEELKEKLK